MKGKNCEPEKDRKTEKKRLRGPRLAEGNTNFCTTECSISFNGAVQTSAPVETSIMHTNQISTDRVHVYAPLS